MPSTRDSITGIRLPALEHLMHDWPPMSPWMAVAAAAMVTAATANEQRAQRPDVEIVASVQARELRFERVPSVDVTVTSFINGVAGATVDESRRRNLPDQVQPNVTYRDIGIILTITSTLPDIERILDEALGPESRMPAPPQ
jgi:hypothetical protein